MTQKIVDTQKYVTFTETRKITYMKTIDKVIQQQKEWAKKSKVDLQDSEHTTFPLYNLYNHYLDSEYEEDFNQGSGDELSPHEGAPAKMTSLRSSSALCVNVFAPLAINRSFPDICVKCLCPEVLNKSAAGFSLSFESKHATGAKSPANLDVKIEGVNHSIFVESKFLEPYGHPEEKDSPNMLKQSYLDIKSDPEHPMIREKFIKNLPDTVKKELSTWTKCSYRDKEKDYVGIRCNSFQVLDVAQLFKHVFGLMNTYNNDSSKFTLLYIYYKADELQEEELKSFKDILTTGPKAINFRYISYQDFVEALRTNNAANEDHLRYLNERYSL